MALYYHLKGLSLDESYDELAKKVGKFYLPELFNIYFEGSKGQEEMDNIMKELERKPFLEILGNKVLVIEDYFSLVRKDMVKMENSKIEGLPKGDLVKFYLEDGSNIAIRPSGTEPKCKFYIEVTGKDREETLGKPEKYFAELKKLLGIK